MAALNVSLVDHPVTRFAKMTGDQIAQLAIPSRENGIGLYHLGNEARTSEIRRGREKITRIIGEIPSQIVRVGAGHARSSGIAEGSILSDRRMSQALNGLQLLQ